MKIFMIDLEWNCLAGENPELGDLMNFAYVLYAYPSKNIISHFQCTVKPETLSDFWKRKDNQEALQYILTNPNYSRENFEKEIAERVRGILDKNPKCVIVLDNPMIDGALINQILKKHGKKELNYDASNNHKHVLDLTSYFKPYNDLQINIVCYYYPYQVIKHTAFGDCIIKLQKYMSILDYLETQKKWRL